MTVQEKFNLISTIEIPEFGFPVEETVAQLVREKFRISGLERIPQLNLKSETNRFQIAVISSAMDLPFEVPQDREWIFVQLNAQGKGKLLASRPNLLYSFICRILEECLLNDGSMIEKGQLIEAAFKWHRVNFDLMVCNYGRTLRNNDLETYVKTLARLGYTHWEVNSLATPVALEEGVYYEVYPRFYTYAAALDQFVESRLNKGTYPVEYLEANLNKMKKMVQTGLKYGLIPGIHCFEPRSMPEKFFQRYPFLRGPRVDHPFRSQKPRFSLTLVHPAAREHYTELVENLMKAVPEMGFIKIVSNDSGAGFEFTKSLYVGANGGPYLIREWNPDREVAQAAASNAIRFLRLIRDAGSTINPELRVITHLEPFYTEREFFIESLGDRIDVEGASFLGTGWISEDAPYHHPQYEDVKEILGTALHTQFDPREKKFIDVLGQRNSVCHINYSHGFVNNSEPLLGIPFPWLTYEKLHSIHSMDLRYLGHGGGGVPPSHANWYINQEVLREFHMNPQMDIDEFIRLMAQRWVGQAAEQLVTAWKKFEAGYRGYPPVYLYSGFGHSWYKLFVRPIVPDIEKIPETERAYYEDFMLTTPHNPTRVDLNRDVMFKLMTSDHAYRIVQRIDENVLPFISGAIDMLENAINDFNSQDNARLVFQDQRDRMVAFKCWIRTLRNVAAWIAGVYTYLETDDPQKQQQCREILKSMVLDEIENARELLALWENSDTEFMMISEVGETTFIYGENFGELVKRKIRLMQNRENDEPYIDPDFMWRVPGYEIKRLID